MSQVPSGSSGGPGFGSFLKGGSLSGGISDVGSAVSDLFAAEGDQAEAKNYEQAAGLATEEAQFTQLTTGVQEIQQQRQITQALGSETAGYASSGMAMSGTALDVLQSSAEQGALAKQMTQFKGEQQVAAYDEQAASYTEMADAAKNASKGGVFGAIVQGVAAIANFAAILPLPKG